MALLSPPRVSSGTHSFHELDSVEEMFTIVGDLGQGNSGYVRIARDLSNGDLYALKTVLKDHANPWMEDELEIGSAECVAQVEIDALLTVSGHPNIVQFLGQYEDEKGTHILMDFCEGGDLCDYLQEHDDCRLPYDEAAFIIGQIASALLHCHDRNILHRDVKAENVLISGLVPGPDGIMCPLIKVADFGSSVFLESQDDKIIGLAGTALYAAPEVVSGGHYGFEADVWSLGIVLHVALSGADLWLNNFFLPPLFSAYNFPSPCSGMFPFYGQNDKEIFESICNGRLAMSSPIWKDVPCGAKDLLQSMLTVDAAQRATMEDVLSHPWIEEHSRSFHIGTADEFGDLVSTAEVVCFPENESLDGDVDDLYCAIPVVFPASEQ